MNHPIRFSSDARAAPLPRPFDSVATGYDERFTERVLGQWLRAAVWERLEATFEPGDHVLELGCGTGEDAIHLAQLGIRVTATDSSPRMLATAIGKAELVGPQRIDFAHFDFAAEMTGASGDGTDRQDLARLRSLGPYDGAFSNFGALNCLPSRAALAESLADLMHPGAPLVVVVMGPICPWEIVWHLAHGQPRKAFRRLRSGHQAHIGDGVSLPVWYPSPRRLRRELAPRFRHVKTVGIGVFLPPSYLAALVERYTPGFAGLRWLDRRLSARFPWSWAGDHYLATFARR